MKSRDNLKRISRRSEEGFNDDKLYALVEDASIILRKCAIKNIY